MRRLDARTETCPDVPQVRLGVCLGEWGSAGLFSERNREPDRRRLHGMADDAKGGTDQRRGAITGRKDVVDPTVDYGIDGRPAR